MPEHIDGEAAQQVEIGPAILVPDGGALTSHQGELGRAVVVHHGRLPTLCQTHAGVTIVPNPSSVKISSSSECGTLPSTMCAAGTPPRTARRQASILGIMPDSSDGSSSASTSALIREMSE